MTRSFLENVFCTRLGYPRQMFRLTCQFKFSGLFFVLPKIDQYSKVDLRTVSFDVPPQEVIVHFKFSQMVVSAV